METPTPSVPVPQAPAADPTPELSRRGFLRGAAVAGGGLVAVGIAGCTAAAAPPWTYGPRLAPASPGAPAPSTAAPASAAASPAASMSHPAASAAPSGAPGAAHDDAALAVVKRFLGGEAARLDSAGNKPLEPKLAGQAKVFDLTIETIKHRIDAQKDPIDAPGYNGTWPGPLLRVVEGDPVRATFRNNLAETT
ncbi:MAG TPA: multicopper oxidase domain-containing protein, partial [Candidatus Limnocylindrales bacterium]|nr:multicopper oxidase domain-containing protein [Candidatus Limnocylindrales bacterium]